jgi:hypothetical protein
MSLCKSQVVAHVDEEVRVFLAQQENTKGISV